MGYNEIGVIPVKIVLQYFMIYSQNAQEDRVIIPLNRLKRKNLQSLDSLFYILNN